MHEAKKEWCLTCHKNAPGKTFDFDVWWKKLSTPSQKRNNKLKFIAVRIDTGLHKKKIIEHYPFAKIRCRNARIRGKGA